MPQLTITADDFGIGYETSRGIIDAHLAGAVDATSVMTVTGDHLLKSAPLIARTSTLRFGLHITLTGNTGRPLTARRKSGLVGRDGNFFSLGTLWLQAAAGRVDLAAAADEIRAQAARFREVLGFAPAHVDGHHHAHQLPGIAAVVAGLIADGTLPNTVRSTVEPPASRRKVSGDRIRRAAIHYLGQSARPALSSADPRLPDGFVGVLSSRMLKSANPWSQYVQALPESGTFEMMVHPGHPDSTLLHRDDYLAHRTTELNALLALGPLIRFFSPHPLL